MILQIILSDQKLTFINIYTSVHTFPKKTIVSKYEKYVQQFYGVLTRVVRISRDSSGLDIYSARWCTFTYIVKSLHFAATGQRFSFAWLVSIGLQPAETTRYVVFVARLYSNVVPGGLSRCKTRNTTRQIMPPPRPLASTDRRRLACTELRGATTRWIETYR